MDRVAHLAAALADRYRIERELGQGGMATVYLAEDLKHERKVALKVLKPELAAVLGAERFVRRDHDHRSAAASAHPAAVRLGHRGRLPVLRHALHRRRDAAGQAQSRDAARRRRGGADRDVRSPTRCDYAHGRASSIATSSRRTSCSTNGRPMVADFGIALAGQRRGRRPDDGDRALVRDAALHVARAGDGGQGDHRRARDIYSLASVLYEMLAGNRRTSAASAQQIIMKIIAEPAAAGDGAPEVGAA